MLLGSDYLDKVRGSINCRTGEWVRETSRLQRDESEQEESEGSLTEDEGRCVLETGQTTEALTVSGPMDNVVETLRPIQEDVEEGEAGVDCVVQDDADGHLQCSTTKRTYFLTAVTLLPPNPTAFERLPTGSNVAGSFVIEEKYHAAREKNGYLRGRS